MYYVKSATQHTKSTPSSIPGLDTTPSGLVSVTHGSNSLNIISMLISQANNLLGMSYQLYKHIETNEIIICAINYSLPAVLHTHVQTIAPTTHFASREVEAGEPAAVLPNRNYEETTLSFLRQQY
ncbi:hypothetical protein EDB87DRAFT_1685044 [Lactarius vividus]|nr:hypothetical protein EDB87DRAFT_1685044 [Lactarius vividus]